MQHVILGHDSKPTLKTSKIIMSKIPKTIHKNRLYMVLNKSNVP